MKEIIIVFTKFPEEGKVKTRLAERIGSKNALEIYMRLLRHTEEQLKLSGKKYVVYWGNYIPTDMLFFRSAEAHYLQSEGDLGRKMQCAFSDQFALGYDSVAGIGCDCIQLNGAHIKQAFQTLQSYSVVYGPANDGGYYLIGMNELHDFLFEDLPWSTEVLLNQCKTRLNQKKISFSEIDELSDVDYFEDLPNKWKDEFRV